MNRGGDSCRIEYGFDHLAALVAFCVIVGDDELAAGQVKLKNMQTGEEKTLAKAELSQAITSQAEMPLPH
jgi:histidyl-tRNA synthetase